MSKTAIKTLLISVLCFLSFSFSRANDVYFHHLGIKDGLTQISIFSLYQDETGAMWFGSFEGMRPSFLIDGEIVGKLLPFVRLRIIKD